MHEHDALAHIAGERHLVRHDKHRHALVRQPDPNALAAQQIDEESLVLLCDPNAPAEDEVPADLVW